VAVWRRTRRIAAQCAGRADLEWAFVLMRMTQVSVLVFAVGGAFLGLLHYDLPYYLAAIVVLVDVAVREAQTRAAAEDMGAIAGTVEARGV
jgi:hypothetical protein